jgi:hypothetical protein
MLTQSQKEIERQQTWVDTTAEQRQKISRQGLSKAGGGNSKASRLSKLSSLMAEKFVKGNEKQVGVLELCENLIKIAFSIA